ncbi:hypothetical protein NAEGRDRAFT_81187 [Naegleria gruberi]|uniref:Uncharacterized protein n=1 Tax=Naegleria gruberi TaxID=5762 RepID=D2VTQ3_NAEGR|nr:uncharacterized protein NAEGRDRAFT_81187 [Naegleria gruberi]EFC39694.1 hypothetical protein NAEGRDRAFT_81187 [Naegleria gruberi]|eukprot:XP_002672438.1 hypothetical protein NAEGRDRAFT_81187 [Naegleria gruberi strain NEG-M]
MSSNYPPPFNPSLNTPTSSGAQQQNNQQVPQEQEGDQGFALHPYIRQFANVNNTNTLSSADAPTVLSSGSLSTKQSLDSESYNPNVVGSSGSSPLIQSSSSPITSPQQVIPQGYSVNNNTFLPPQQAYYTNSGIFRNVPSHNGLLSDGNIEPVLNKGEGPQFQYFGIGPCCCWEVLVWILSKMTFGIVEAFFAIPMANSQISEMIVGGRRLKFDTHDPWLKVPILCIINNFINSSTFGLWYLSGMMHIFYYSELDRRISWGEVVDPDAENNIVWHPIDDGREKFKILSAFPGVTTEIVTWGARLFSVTFLLGFAEPWIKSYYYSRLMPKMEFGGVGQFYYANKNPTTYGRDKLKVVFNARGHQIFFRWLQGHIIVLASCGMFLCCFGNWIDAFMNRYLHVDETVTTTLSPFIISEESLSVAQSPSEPSTYNYRIPTNV